MDGAGVLAAALVLAERSGAPESTVLAEYRRLLGDLPTRRGDPSTAVRADGGVDVGPPELLLGRLCEDRLEPGERRRRGSWYTPWPLASGLVRFAIGALDGRCVPGSGPTVHDPAVGGGVFLLAAAEILVADRHPDVVVGLLSGTDLDPIAVFAARMSLWFWNRRQGGSAPPPRGIRVADGLSAPDSHDLVVGNPPFGGRLRGPTVLPDTKPEAGAYTDLAGLFLLSSLRRTRPGGVVAMIQPTSVLASRDGEPVRSEAAARGRTIGIWRGERVFTAQVDVCAPVVAVGRGSGSRESSPITILGGPDAEVVGMVSPESEPGDTLWPRAVARAGGVPEPAMVVAGPTLGEVAVVSADFRDQYYGLVDLLDGSHGDGHPGDDESVAVVTVGLIDPLRDLTPVRTTRLGKVVRNRPRVGLAALSESPLARWAAARMVPKVLVASQTRVVEALADPDGSILPCTPVVSVVPGVEPGTGSTPGHRTGVWHLAALLVSPPATAWLAARATGTGLSAGAFRVRCGQLRELPLPTDRDRWDRAADLARRSQSAISGREARSLLLQVGRTMCSAYGITTTETSELMAWWEDRLPPVRD